MPVAVAGRGSNRSFPLGGSDCRAPATSSSLSDSPSPQRGALQLLRKLACMSATRRDTRHRPEAGTLMQPWTRLSSLRGALWPKTPMIVFTRFAGASVPTLCAGVVRGSDLSGLNASSVSVGAVVLVLAAPVADCWRPGVVAPRGRRRHQVLSLRVRKALG